MSRTTRRSRRGRALVLVALLLAAGGLLVWTRSGDAAPAAAGTATATPTAASAPSSAAPSSAPPRTATPSSTAPGEDAGPTASEEPLAPSSQPAATSSPQEEPAGGLRPVTVALTYTGYDPDGPAVVVGGYAADVVEVDATCTLVLRREGVELRGESLGTPSATTTDCGEVRVGGADLTSGTWEAVLGYTSPTSVGQSPAGEVVVP